MGEKERRFVFDILDYNDLFVTIEHKSCVCVSMDRLSLHSLRLTADIAKVWKENLFTVEGVDLGRINRHCM